MKVKGLKMQSFRGIGDLTLEFPTDEPIIKLAALYPVTNNIRGQWEGNSEANIPLVVYYPVNRAVFDITLEIPSENLINQMDAYEQALDGTQIGFASFNLLKTNFVSYFD